MMLHDRVSAERNAVWRRSSDADAGVAQLVEHQLPKLRVASSSLVSRFSCFSSASIDAL